jgi:hypothetical protein
MRNKFNLTGFHNDNFEINNLELKFSIGKSFPCRESDDKIIFPTIKSFVIFDRNWNFLNIIDRNLLFNKGTIQLFHLQGSNAYFNYFENNKNVILNFNLSENSFDEIDLSGFRLDYLRFNQNFTIFKSGNLTSIGIYDCKKNEILWKKQIEKLSLNLVSDENILISNIDGNRGKICLDLQNGNEIWRVYAENYIELNELKSIGENFLIDNYVLGKTKYKSDLSLRYGPDETWFAIDKYTTKMIWNTTIPWLCLRKIGYPNTLYGIYLNEKNLKFYFIAMNLITGEIIERVDITTELLKVKDPECDLYYLDAYLRQMLITNDDIYFGLGRHIIKMSRQTYEMQILLKGKGVCENISFINGRLIINQLIGETFVFAEKDNLGLEIDTFFNNSEYCTLFSN